MDTRLKDDEDLLIVKINDNYCKLKFFTVGYTIAVPEVDM